MNLIYDRLKICHGINSDLELARLLGIKKTTLSMQRNRGTVDLSAVLRVSEGVDLNWLLRSSEEEVVSSKPDPINTSEQTELYRTDEKKLVDEIIKLRKKVAHLEEKLQKR